MRIRHILSALLALVPLALLQGRALQASEEEFLEYSEVRIVFMEREDTSKVVLVAKAGEEKLKEVTIEAFGKKYVVEQAQLDQLSGFPLSSLVVTHEGGYERLGGHMIHFKFKKVHVAGEGRLIEEKVRLSVSKGKGISVVASQPREVK
jgi:hypothetical protein